MVSDAYYRNIKATFRHIDAAFIRELPPGQQRVHRVEDNDDREARVAVEGGVCWRNSSTPREITPDARRPNL